MSNKKIPNPNDPQSNDTTINNNSRKEEIEPAVKTHGILLTFCWFFFADIAAFLITYRYRKYTYWAHAILMTMNMGISILLGLLMMK